VRRLSLLPSFGFQRYANRPFIRAIGSLNPGDLPPVLDLEVPAEWAGITAADRVPLAVQWLEAVESQLGVTSFVYLSPSFANEILMNAPALARFPLWLAHYTNAPSPTVPPWIAWTFWQNSRGNNGRDSAAGGPELI
jgi:lysozyme